MQSHYHDLSRRRACLSKQIFRLTAERCKGSKARTEKQKRGFEIEIMKSSSSRAKIHKNHEIFVETCSTSIQLFTMSSTQLAASERPEGDGEIVPLRESFVQRVIGVWHSLVDYAQCSLLFCLCELVALLF
jgi:hypothetical protein